MSVLSKLEESSKSRTRRLAVLIDPDKSNADLLDAALSLSPDFVFVGGSLLVRDDFEKTITELRVKTDVPLVIFPGSAVQVHSAADAILFLSLISGRNPEFLIGQQVLAAPAVIAAGIEAIPTGYMLVESGTTTTAEYVSQTKPLPRNKPEIAAATAAAGKLLGLKAMYLDAGSGARNAVPAEMISAVKRTVNAPLIVGGGIRSTEQAEIAWQAGADVVVVGTAAEENMETVREIAAARFA
jgi:phosphoglycerol geranylgeranyltransferase